ncbi:cytochrome oxidase complex assembly protein 1-domain-containing protein [Mycena capillaripes]|nr:cytochrome oxidase complex assembly protein 1-domain-containing protein [Mycena capillaripes]
MTTTMIFRRSIPVKISAQFFNPVRRYVTSFLRPPPPTEEPSVTTFSGPSHPELKIWPFAIASTALGCCAALFSYVTNEAKSTSSVVQNVLGTASIDPKIREQLGDDVGAQPEWWLNGQPRIRGEVDHVQGSIDLSITLRGSVVGAGTLYFRSVREADGIPYEIVARFEMITDDGAVLKVDHPMRSILFHSTLQYLRIYYNCKLRGIYQRFCQPLRSSEPIC